MRHWDEDAVERRADIDKTWRPPKLPPRLACASCGCSIRHPSFIKEDPEMPGRFICRVCFRWISKLLIAREEKRENVRRTVKP